MLAYAMMVCALMSAMTPSGIAPEQGNGPVLSATAPRWTPDTTGWWRMEFFRERSYGRFDMRYRTNDMVARLLTAEGLCEASWESCRVRFHIRFFLHERPEGERHAGAVDRIAHYAAQGPSGTVLQGYAHDIVQDGEQRERMDHWLMRENGWESVQEPGIVYDRLQWLVKDVFGLVLLEDESRRKRQ